MNTLTYLIYEYLSIWARERILIRSPIVVPTNRYQQSTSANGIHMAGWRAGRRMISEGRDYYPANITAESTLRYITCRQNTRLFLYDSKHT